MPLPGDEALDGLKSLHRDLVDLSESRLPNIERLQAELEAHIDDFRALLDKSPKNDRSRQALASEKIKIGDEEYAVNDTFKQDTIQVADFLDLDELEAAKLYASAVQDTLALDRSPITTSVILFHERRQFLLECLRLCFQIANEPEFENEELQEMFHTLRGLIFQKVDGQAGDPSIYWQKCQNALTSIETWLQQLSERAQTLSLTGQIQSNNLTELIQFQQSSLSRQHQSLSVAGYHMFQNGHVKVAEFQNLLTKLKSFEKCDAALVHYIPLLSAGISYFNSASGQCSAAEADKLNHSIVSIRDNDAWGMRSFQAAATAIWIAEYSARFGDQIDSSNSTDEAAAKTRSEAFVAALRDGAFHFILTISKEIKDNPWADPIRHNLLDLLLQDTPVPQVDSFNADEYFRDILLKQLQLFVEACVTNIPDSLRDLKSEEDELRRQMFGRLQMHAQEYELHLERFFLIAALAYEDFESAAESFWAEPDGNMYGFLQWASQRQSTPHVAAFCDMLRALAEGERGANYAHKFLLDEIPSVSGRLRRNSPLSWAHIIREIDFFSSTIRDRPAPQQNKGQTEQYVEPESAAMLELYLRLFSHLCQRSSEVRAWFLTHQTFHIHEHLLLLCGSAIESRLRACCFTALAALLVNKTREVGEGMWSAVDAWVCGNNPSSSLIARPPPGQASGAPIEQLIFQLISTGFDEPVAFVGLLRALVLPYQDEIGVDDSLPFPEALGSAYRMPGMEPYVDFVLGRVFAAKSVEIHGPSELRLMRWRCLQFIETCLSTFNEDLVIYANQSTVSVDTVMRTSSLAAYIRMHPFARVMEWMFNDSVVQALFSAAMQDMGEVNDASSDSPLIASIFLSIKVIELTLSMQATYFDIVRPTIKMQSHSRRDIVSNSALASFDDAILNNLDIVQHLGFYCGSGHDNLTVASLRLLQKLASLRKLSAPLTSNNGRALETSRLITAVEKDNQIESISRSLILQMEFDERDFVLGPDSPGYHIKSSLIQFILSCLTANLNRPSIAHSLLGFTCYANALGIDDEGLWSKGASLFHEIVRFAMALPVPNLEELPTWLMTMKEETLAIIVHLAKAPISAPFVLPELRQYDFLVAQWVGQPVVGPDSPLDMLTIDDSSLLAEASNMLAGLLRHRSNLFEYASMEIRSTDISGLATLQNRIKSTVLGTASFSEGPSLPCQTIFELADLPGAARAEILPLPQSKFFDVKDLESCSRETGYEHLHNIEGARQLLSLRLQELRGKNQLGAVGDEQQAEADAQNILYCLEVNNHRLAILEAHKKALDIWARLLMIVLDSCEFEQKEADAILLQALQTVVPRLEQTAAEDLSSSITFAKLGRSLMSKKTLSSGGNVASSKDVINDGFFHLFRLALAHMQTSASTAELREICFHILYDYLGGISKMSDPGQARRQALQSLKSRANEIFDIVCDEASGGESSSRTSALLVLGAIVRLANTEGAKFVLDAFNRVNFIQIIIDSIKNLAVELQDQNSAEQILSYHMANLALIQRICQSRAGASYVVNAGLFNSIRESGLFQADPDIGLEFDNPAALNTYFKLLLAIVRILNAAVISRGQQNEQTVLLAQGFIDEYRPSIVAVFKRNAKIGLTGGSVTESNSQVLEELADALTVLMVSSGFLDTEETHDKTEAANRLPLFS